MRGLTRELPEVLLPASLSPGPCWRRLARGRRARGMVRSPARTPPRGLPAEALAPGPPAGSRRFAGLPRLGRWPARPRGPPPFPSVAPRCWRLPVPPRPPAPPLPLLATRAAFVFSAGSMATPVSWTCVSGAHLLDKEIPGPAGRPGTPPPGASSGWRGIRGPMRPGRRLFTALWSSAAARCAVASLAAPRLRRACCHGLSPGGSGR